AITLLESLGRRLVSLYPNSPKSAWQSDLASRLHELQEAALARASEALTGGDASQQALQEYIEPHQVTRVASRFDLASEPHWRSLLRLAFQFRVQDLRSRTALPVDDGCRVMGAADPHGVWPRARVYLR
uniref:RNA-dependent RNA polymerase n=1 Tax=Macrostomum lignano TaxID=282301 RepID=A0A1I8FH82_9PLAT